jgi:hypothetical protein
MLPPRFPCHQAHHADIHNDRQEKEGLPQLRANKSHQRHVQGQAKQDVPWKPSV